MTTHPNFQGWYNAAGERWCSRCRCYMALDQFHRNRARVDGYAHNCRLCTRAIRRRTYERRRAQEIASARAWQAAHPAATRAAHRRGNRVYARLHADRRHAAYVRRRDAQRDAAREAQMREDEREERAG